MKKPLSSDPLDSQFTSSAAVRPPDLLCESFLGWYTAAYGWGGDLRKYLNGFSCLELCAGGGGQAIGIERAGFSHAALLELDSDACRTLSANRPEWKVIWGDIRAFDGSPYLGIDVLSAGLPCPPFSRAGKQLGVKDERNLFPDALRIVGESLPRILMIENVRGILDPPFDEFRAELRTKLKRLGYCSEWRLLNASDYGVSQLRPRAIMIALRVGHTKDFDWPRPAFAPPPPVCDVLKTEMSARGWRGFQKWREKANAIAPTIVGGSHKHGGPDLGPTRAKKAWAALGVDGHGIADEPPPKDFVGSPRLTTKMVALLQGFPSEWAFCGGKTSTYRQIGNAFPPPVAAALGESIRKSLSDRKLARVAS